MGGGPPEAKFAVPPSAKPYSGKEVKAKAVEQPPIKTIEPWKITVGSPGWLASATGSSGFHGINSSFDVRVGQMLPRLNLIIPLAGEPG
jgi:hypothetical protein